MKIAFLISEYNPFHHGHAYHLEQTRKRSKADAVVAVMSGNFTQRGEAAILDKYTRASVAVRCGVDCVLELPFPFAAGAAPEFALGGIKIINSVAAKNCFLSFGSESGNLSDLLAAALALSAETPAFSAALRDGLDSGLSYPAAVISALQKSGEGKTAQILSGSNDILAIEYLKAIQSTNSPITPLAIPRIGGTHIQTATNIRKALTDKMPENFLPAPSAQMLAQALENGATPNSEILGLLVLSKLRSSSPSRLSQIYGMNEGIENRLIECAKNATSLQELVNAASTKRYSHSHIQRLLLYSLTCLTKEAMQFFKETPPYVKVLALKKERKDILAALSEKGAVIARSDDCTPDKLPLLEIEKTASDIYTLLFKNPAIRKSPQNKMCLV